MSDQYEPTNENEIDGYLHCSLCLDEWKSGARDVAPADFCRLNVGWTRRGLQVWCQRHQVNVVNIDFEGQQHPANTTRRA